MKVQAVLSTLAALCFSLQTMLLIVDKTGLCRRYWRCACVKGMMIEMSDTADVLTMLLILLHLRCKE